MLSVDCCAVLLLTQSFTHSEFADLLHKSYTNKNHPVARRVIFIFVSNIFFKRKESQSHFRDRHMKKKFYKNNVGCYYFYDVSISGKFERIVFIL